MKNDETIVGAVRSRRLSDGAAPGQLHPHGSRMPVHQLLRAKCRISVRNGSTRLPCSAGASSECVLGACGQRPYGFLETVRRVN